MLGRVRCLQSSAEPWRTIRALVKAANDMQIAASTTQIALLDGGGEWPSTTRKLPSWGTRFRQPPFADCPPSGRDRSRRGSTCGGSWTIVPIFPPAFSLVKRCCCRRLLFLRRLNYLGRVLHNVVGTCRSLNPVLIGIVIDDRVFAAEIVPWRR